MSKKIRKSVRQSARDHLANLKRFREKVRGKITKLRLEDQDRETLLALLGENGHAERALASDPRAVRRAAKALVRVLRRERRVHPGRTYYHVTLFGDAGMTSDRTPIARLGFIEGITRRALASVRLDAFVVLEVHPLINYPGGGEGRSLLYHAHAMAWSDGPFDHAAAEKKLNESRAWQCSLGAPPVSVQPIANTERDLIQTAFYVIKMPHSAKNRMPDRKRPGRFLLMDTIEGYRGELALRVFEGLSQVELISLMFGVGAGKVVRQQVRMDLETWQHTRPGTNIVIPASFDVWAFWNRVRQTQGNANYLPYRFDRAPAQAKPPRAPKPVEPQPLKRKLHSHLAEKARHRMRPPSAADCLAARGSIRRQALSVLSVDPAKSGCSIVTG